MEGQNRCEPPAGINTIKFNQVSLLQRLLHSLRQHQHGALGRNHNSSPDKILLIGCFLGAVLKVKSANGIPSQVCDHQSGPTKGKDREKERAEVKERNNKRG